LFAELNRGLLTLSRTAELNTLNVRYKLKLLKEQVIGFTTTNLENLFIELENFWGVDAKKLLRLDTKIVGFIF
jgi:hypothetical protein